MLKRTLYLHNEEPLDALFARATEGICVALSDWARLPLRPDAAEPCSHRHAHAEIEQWQHPDAPAQRLWTLRLEVQGGDGRRLARLLQLGCEGEGNPLILREEWQLTPVQFRPRATLVANAFDWLTPDDLCRNSDNRRGHVAQNLFYSRAAHFGAFVRDSARELPLLLVAYQPTLNDAQLQQLTRLLLGLCHVIVVRDPGGQSRWRQLLPEHECYNGALRLYYPNYADNDNAWDHPFWRAALLQEKPDEAFSDLFDRAAAWSLRAHGANPLASLEQAKLESERAELRRQTRAAIANSRATQSEKEELELLWNTFAEENDSLTADNKRLRDILRQREDDLRALRWQLARKEPGSDTDAPAPECPLRVSEEVYVKLSDFDNGELEQWNKRVFARLIEPELRAAHTESFQNPQGETLFVYPRGRQADGRRVIYRVQGEVVCVYKIFTSAEHDSNYIQVYGEGVAIDPFDALYEWELPVPDF